MNWISAPTTLRAISNFCCSVSVPGRAATIRLCSRAKRVCASVSGVFSSARTSPAIRASSGRPVCGPKRSISGAATALPRAPGRGRKPSGSSSRASLFAGSPSTGPARSQSSRDADSPYTVEPSMKELIWLSCWRGVSAVPVPGAAGVRLKAMLPVSLR